MPAGGRPPMRRPGCAQPPRLTQSVIVALKNSANRPTFDKRGFRNSVMLLRTLRKLCFGWILATLAAGAVPAPAPVVLIPVSGTIGPASADFIERGLARAASLHAQLAVIELDTPGGLDPSMRQIIKAMLASPVPVVTFVAPAGARAASAGTYILYASHIAAMAPGTNLGAATPIQLGIGGEPSPPGPDGDTATDTPGSRSAKTASGAATAAAEPTSSPTRSIGVPDDPRRTGAHKQMQDAAAYIRSLAQLHGRNGEWAERAVRDAVSLPASDALSRHVIDVVAGDLDALLAQLDGRWVSTAHGVRTLQTAHAPVLRIAPDWRTRLLAVITNPNVALILMTIGMYGLFFEFANPGFVLPGVAGAISLLVGLFALHMLPVNYAGLILILLGVVFLIAEAFLPAFGSLGFGGIIAFGIGALMLIDTEVPGFGIPLPLIIALSLLSATCFIAISSIALRARRRPIVAGAETLVGSTGVMLGELAPSHAGDGASDTGEASNGWARIQGEQWRVRSDHALPGGAPVRVTGRHGLTLSVVPAAAPPKPGEHS
ncbi:nodulation protein NfeD (plasmid) [Mycetohabitans rhizoxinica]|uniref:Nodulation protein NfeD n=2 Tax=Mycetohabitans rhizoxinica TaxID=412963 RepID=A0ABZ2PWA2_9BURK